MGVGPFKRSCSSTGLGVAPNPNPSRWKLLDSTIYDNAVVLLVQYLDCTNFEGKKVIVYEGDSATVWKVFLKRGWHPKLDPHFTDKGLSPIARFPPTKRGAELADKLASEL